MTSKQMQRLVRGDAIGYNRLGTKIIDIIAINEIPEGKRELVYVYKYLDTDGYTARVSQYGNLYNSNDRSFIDIVRIESV
jgi:hypothetical protein